MACSFLWCGRGNAHIETAGLVGRTTGKSQRRITLHQGTEHTSPNAHTPPCLARAVSYEDAYRSTLPRAPSAPASHLPSQNRRSFVTTQGMTTGGIRPRSRIYVHYARFEALFTNFRFLHAAPPAPSPPSPWLWVPTCQFSSYFIILLLVIVYCLLLLFITATPSRRLRYAVTRAPLSHSLRGGPGRLGTEPGCTRQSI